MIFCQLCNLFIIMQTYYYSKYYVCPQQNIISWNKVYILKLLSTALMRKLHHLSLNFVKHIWQVLELICYAFQLNLFAALQRKQKCWYVVRTSSNFVRIYLFYYNLAFILFGNSQHIKNKKIIMQENEG